MLFNLWRWIQFWLIPYGILVKIYSRNKALPANIKTWQGNNYKAVLINKDYGILFSADKYIANRGQYLLEQKKQLLEQENAVLNELNDLNMLARKTIYEDYLENQENENGGV